MNAEQAFPSVRVYAVKMPAALVAIVLLAAPLAADPPQEADLKAAVADLVDDRPLVREAARRTILEWSERDPALVQKLLPRGSEVAEIDQALREVRVLLNHPIAIRRRYVRASAAAGADGALLEATRTLLDRLNDAAFLAPALESATRLPETDFVLTPFVLADYASGKVGVCRVMEALLRDDSVGVRRIAARILYYHGSGANELSLVEALTDVDSYIRGGAALTLSHYAVRSSAQAIRMLLADPDPTVRRHATMALEELGVEVAIDAKQVDQMLESADPAARTLAVRALVERGGPGILERLAPLLDDTDPRVRAAVMDGMETLGGFRWDAAEARRAAAKAWWQQRRRD